MLGDGEGGPIPAPARTMLASTDRNTVRLRTLIDDVFTLAKLESGAAATVARPVDLAEIIASGAEAVRPSVMARKLTPACREPPGPLVVDGDAGQLDRVLINLLSNAVKFTPQGGRVEVSAVPDGDHALISVRDTGIGIPDRDKQELFSRFFRASNATARRIPGTGLGLAIVRMIAQHHGGQVVLQSREGVGTTVTVKLPVLVTLAARGPAARGTGQPEHVR